MPNPTTFAFDEWVLHRESGELERAGKRVRLQDLPARVLEELVSRPGELVTREHLIGRLWPKGIIDFETGLNSAVRKLRLALEDDADAPRYIETIPRKGYRFIGRVLRPQQEASTSTAAEAGNPVGVSLQTTGKSPIGIWAPAAVAICVAVLIVGYRWIQTQQPASAQSTPATSSPSRLRLAVLPFQNLSPDSANAFFADGLHEEILSTLANRAPNLDVISRTTMMLYRVTPKSVRDIAKELNVTHVLEGSVRREGPAVRLTVQLIDARSDTHLWSQNFDRQLGSAMNLQSQVAAEVGAQLAVKISGRIAELPPSASAEAYDLYLQALLSIQAVDAMRSLRGQLPAQDLLDRAVILDPSFAAAYVQRARVRMSKFVSSQDVSEANLQDLRADLVAARKLMGDSPPLLISEAEYAVLVDLDANKALRLLGVANAMNPNSSEVALAMARNLSSTLKPSEALPYFERAARLDPGNATIFSDWASFLKMSRLPDQSLRVAREFDARYPGRITYGRRLFGSTGQLRRFQSEVSAVEGTADAGSQLADHFDLLLYGHRSGELSRLVEQSDLTTIPQVSFGGFAIPSIGRKPVAELHGWAKLLEADTAAAARDGRAILAFVAAEPVTRWNAWYLRLLAAEGALFSGDKIKAVADARAAMAMTPRNIHPGIQRYALALAARILAWAGAGNEAVELLDQLSTRFPAIGPAEITRDPLFSAPLGSNPRYNALETRLEAEIAANQELL